eukprot:scaffold214146_cov38-Prasinocladus_malaysianus.AAC.3
MRASVQVTTIHSAYEAKASTPQLAALAEDDEEEEEGPGSTAADPERGEELLAPTPSAEGPQVSEPRSLTPEADTIMETFLQKFSISTPISKLVEQLEEIPGTEVVKPSVRDSAVFYSPRANTETPMTVQLTVPPAKSGSPDADEDFYSPEDKSPLARFSLESGANSPAEAQDDECAKLEQQTTPAQSAVAPVPVGSKPAGPEDESSSRTLNPADIPLPACTLTPLTQIPEDNAASVPVSKTPIPSFWGGLVRSGIDMDASMVLHGSINMAIRESTYGPTASGFRDALDLEDSKSGTDSDTPVAKMPEFESIFEDAAAVAQSLEREDRLQVKEGVAKAADPKPPAQAVKPPVLAGKPSRLGMPSGQNSYQGGSRLRAPKGSYNFFDKVAAALW